MNHSSQKLERMPVRLGLPPKSSNPNVSKSMKGNKAKNTSPEVKIRNALKSLKVKGYELNWKGIPGTPDICFPTIKLAIFVNGCFWHSCPYCKLDLPKSNKIFWSNKFKRNKERDRLKKRRLKSLGWKSMTIWECQIRKHLDRTIQRISTALKNRRSCH